MPSIFAHRMVDINYLGTVNVIKACLPSMKSSGNGGHIVLFSSIAGLFGLYGYSAYSPSKFAIVGLAQVLAMEVINGLLSHSRTHESMDLLN